MSINCPNCGHKIVTDNNFKIEFLLAMLHDLGARTNNDGYCSCSEAERLKAVFWKGNEMTEEKAREIGDLAYKTWKTHNEPDRADCRRFNYGYFVKNGRVICEALGDYCDITDSIQEA